VASEESTYPVMAGFKWRRYFFGFNAAPLSPRQIVNGVAAGACVRMFIVVAAYYVIIWVFRAVPHPETGWLSIIAGVLGGLAFGAPLMAYAASIEDDRGQFALVQRFIFMPLFLFSGTFYPLGNVGWLQWIGWLSPVWHASELSRMVTYGRAIEPWLIAVHLGYLVVLAAIGLLAAHNFFGRRLSR
jgi:lipooligosaccharide transport system permease protein